MKKLLVIALTFFSVFVLNACGSDEIPDDATVAVCDTFKYVYKDDVVYEFYSNDELQNQDMLNIVQTSVDVYDDARAYLEATFLEGVCTYTNYSN